MENKLENYKDIHKGEDIYIIGSGSSCKTQYLMTKESKLISYTIKKYRK